MDKFNNMKSVFALESQPLNDSIKCIKYIQNNFKVYYILQSIQSIPLLLSKLLTQ